MKRFSLSHLEDHELLRALNLIVRNDWQNTAVMLAHIAEVDARRLYRPAAHASMFSYCVRELHMSEETAYRRIRAARAARRFPAIFELVADGRLNVTAVVLLAPHLVSENAGELLPAAVHRSRRDIELLLAERFPKEDVPTVLRRITSRGEMPSTPETNEVAAPSGAAAADRDAEPLSVSRTEPLALAPVVPSQESESRGCVGPLLGGETEQVRADAKIAPLSPERFALQVTLSRTTHDLLREAQALLGHELPSGDISQVLERALGEMVQRLRKQKYGKTSRPRAQHTVASGRHIPAAIRRAVVARDGDQCTFVNAKGKRCDERTRLEFDHVKPIGVGGQTTVENLRLRCRAHNQYAAECAYGEGFMGAKRGQARNAPVHEAPGSM